jgi:hypothetical protein
VLLIEFEACHFAKQPAAQRPRAIVFAGNGEDGLGHRSYLVSLSCQRFTLNQRLRVKQRTSWAALARGFDGPKLHPPPIVQDVHNFVAAQQKMH